MALKDVYFVMLSSSNVHQDVEESQRLGADEYRVKPSQLRDLVEMVGRVESEN